MIAIKLFIIFISLHLCNSQILLSGNGYSTAAALLRENGGFELPNLLLDFDLIEEKFENKNVRNLTWGSEQCLLNWLFLAKSLKSKELWAIKVVDSFGRPKSGIANGNIKWIGNYGECTNISADGTIEIRNYHHSVEFIGKYCVAEFSVPGAPTARVPGSEYLGKIMIALCVPENCAPETAQHVINAGVKNPEKFNYLGIRCPEKPSEFDAVAKLAIACLIILFIFITFAAAIECFGITRQPVQVVHSNNYMIEDDTEPLTATSQAKSKQYLLTAIDVVLCFSLKQNLNNFLRPKESAQKISALDGIRVLSMFWIILGNTYLVGFSLTSNPLEFLDPTRHGFFFQIVLQAVLAIDGFFVISGFLVAFHFFRRIDSDKSVLLNFLKTLALRIIRLLPAYAILMAVYLGFWKYLAKGPFWKGDGAEIDYCRKTWWTNLLFINNIVDHFYNGTLDGKLHRQYCMEWTWSMAVEMQLFLFSPVILFPLYRTSISTYNGPFHLVWKWSTWLLIGFLAILSITVSAAIHNTYDMPPNLFPPNLTLAPKSEAMASFVYYRPYAHFPSYLIGLIVGYFVANRNRHSLTLPRWFFTVCWILSLAIAGASLFTIWIQYRGHVFARWVATVYDSGSRLGWSIAVGWIIFACNSNQKGFVNQFLSWSFWQPLSRATYCTFLVHPMLMVAYYYSRKQAIYYTDETMTWFFGSFILYGYVLGIAAHLFIEAPFLQLRKLISK